MLGRGSRLIAVRMLLLALVAPAILAAPADGADHATQIELYAHWPPTMQAALSEPIPVTPLFPAGEADLSSGPALPQSSADGSLARFTYSLVNPDGSQGPVGAFDLQPSEPATLTFFLSADQTPWPTAVGEAPMEADYGLAPTVTVTAQLRVGDQVVGQGAQTQDLVSLPEPAGASVHAYEITIPFEAGTVQPGEGLFVDITVHQLETDGERVMQPAWNVHTGEAYPTAIQVPIEPGESLTTHDEPTRTLAGIEMEERQAKTVALWALVASVAIAALAGVRLVNQARQR